MQIEMSGLALILTILAGVIAIIAPSITIAAVTLIITLKLFVRPEEVEAKINRACDTMRKENIEHCKSCTKAESLKQENIRIDQGLNVLGGKIDDLKDLIIKMFNNK